MAGPDRDNIAVCSFLNLQEVAVETLEKGFRIGVYSEKNYDDLLVSVLNVFDNLGLDVLDATISCSESFSLEALLGSKVSTPTSKLQLSA